MRRTASRRIGLALGGSVLVLVVWFHHGGQPQRPTPTPSQTPSSSLLSDGDGDLPDDLLIRAAPAKEPKAVKKTGNREGDLMARMEKSMLKAAMKEEHERARLPKPQEILQEAVGPAGRVEPQPASSQPAMKLLVIAREGVGFPVLGQFLTKEIGVFEHGEPPMEVAVVSNLFNCILSPEMVATFKQQVAGRFGESPYFREECLLDSQAVCSDPLSYESMCSRRPHQLLLSRNYPLSFVRKLLEDNEDLRVIFLIRDPRGTVTHDGQPRGKHQLQIDSFCSNLLDDLLKAEELATLHPRRFAKAMYETLATRPLVEVTKLLSSLGLPLSLSSGLQGGDKMDWSKDGNSVQKVNGWKASLGGVHLQKIENQCLEVLSRLEYPLLGQGVAGAVKQ